MGTNFVAQLRLRRIAHEGLRKAPSLGTIFRFGSFEVDRDRHQLRRGNRRIKIERIPLNLLSLLIEQEGNIVTREEIVSRLWGDNLLVDTERSINTAIRKVRRALEDDARRPKFIETVMGMGYCFLPVSAAAYGRRASDGAQEDAISPELVSTEPKEIRLIGFRIETNDGAAMLTCDIVREKTTVGRLPLVRLELPQGMTLPLKPEDKLLMKLLGVRVTLTAEAAQALQAFCIRYLQNGSSTHIEELPISSPQRSHPGDACEAEVEQMPPAENQTLR